jgi:hypothetical protein
MNDSKSDYINKLNYDSKESKLFMPNEIFEDLHKVIDKTKHIPFTYAYYYLISWLYRYAKYGTAIDNKMIKSLLGYSPTYTEIDYLIKKNGVLDEINYTYTEKDFPVGWSYTDGDLEFDLISDYKEDDQKYISGTRSRKYSIKYPIKAFHRNGDETILDGTFYEIDRTYLVPFDTFLFCMSKKDIGVTGFYIWSYLKMQNQIYEKGYDVSIGDLSNETKIPRSTLCSYLNKLKGHKMINCYYNQEFFCLALKDDDRKANTYVTNDYEKFSDEMVGVEKMKFMSADKYLDMQKEKENVDIERLFT